MFKRIHGGLQEKRKREKFRVFRGCMNSTRKKEERRRKNTKANVPLNNKTLNNSINQLSPI